MAAGRTGRGDSPSGSSLLAMVLHARWLSLVAVLGSLVGSVVMFAMASVTTYDAVRTYFRDHPGDGKETEAAEAMIELIGALDEALFGLLLIVFAIGIVQLFLLDPESAASGWRDPLPPWLHVHSLTELKVMLVELVIVLFIVEYLGLVIREVDEFDWQLLVVPISVGIFAVVLYVLRSDPDTDR